MLGLLALLIMAPAAPPDEAVIGQFYRAIWNDLFQDSMLFTGNALGSLWYQAGSDNPGAHDLHIRNLRCHGRDPRWRCTFNLFRDGGVGVVYGMRAPDRLFCRADFERRADGELAVRHLPLEEEDVHSLTTMRCRRSS